MCSVVCGLWYVVRGLWPVVCGLWSVCCVLCAVCCALRVVGVVLCAECCVLKAVCCVLCALCCVLCKRCWTQKNPENAVWDHALASYRPHTTVDMPYCCIYTIYHILYTAYLNTLTCHILCAQSDVQTPYTISFIPYTKHRRPPHTAHCTQPPPPTDHRPQTTDHGPHTT